MKKDMEMYLYQISDCLYACLIYFCKLNNLDYRMLFFTKFYYSELGVSSYKVNNHFRINENELLHLYTISKITDITDEKSISIFYLNLYNCFWSFFYKKVNAPHFLIVEFNKKKYYGTDKYFGVSDIIIDEEWVKNNVWKYMKIDIERHKINSNNILKLAIFYLHEYKKESIVKCKKKLVDAVKSIDCNINKYKKDHYIGIPIITQLKTLSDNRMCYIYALEYLQEKTQIILTTYMCLIKKISLDWEKLKLFLLKSIIKNNYNNFMEQIEEQIEGNFNKEFEIVDKLLYKLQKNS